MQSQLAAKPQTTVTTNLGPRLTSGNLLDDIIDMSVAKSVNAAASAEPIASVTTEDEEGGSSESLIFMTPIDRKAIDETRREQQLVEYTTKAQFYTQAQKYWDGVEPTVDGMLGGFAPINAMDIRGSLAYLQSLFRLKPAPKRRWALDCGAGIGRVTRFLLMPQYEHVDAVEQCGKFCQEMRDYIGPAKSRKLDTIYNCGLQEFTPEAGKYDLIWSQWVLGHLTDADLVAFFQRCVRGLSKNGLMVLKENVTSSELTEIDETDSSFTRPLAELKRLLGLGGMRVLRCQQQMDFPAGIYPVYMITVRPVVAAPE